VSLEALALTAERQSLRRGQLERNLRHVFKIDPTAPQLALVRAADGRPVGDAITEEQAYKYFGCERAALGKILPTIIVVIAGIRSGKSFLVALAAATRAMMVEMGHLKPHIVARVPIVCPKSENAKETFGHLLGAVVESRGLASCVEGKPTMSPYPSLVLRRFDRRHVRVRIVPADAGGLSVRSGNIAMFVLDEAALFGDAEKGSAVNAAEIMAAAETRLLPGGQGWIVSSPFGPEGLLYDLYSKHFGKPGRVLVMRAPTLDMNPYFSRELVDQIRAHSPDVAAREYDAEFIDADSAFFEGLLIDAAARAEGEKVDPQPGAQYLATMDAATRANAWTLTIARDTRKPAERLGRVEIAFAHEWIGSRSEPLDPEKVFDEMIPMLAPYGITKINCDAYAIDPLRSVARSKRLHLLEHTFQGEQKTAVYRSVDMLLRTRRLSLPRMVVRDLKAVRKRATEGAVRPFLPTTPDGRHCDFASAVSLATWLLSGHSFSRELADAMATLEDAGGAAAFFADP
jgi:hypothetical protein